MAATQAAKAASPKKKVYTRTPAQRRRIREAVKKSWRRRKLKAARTGELLRKDQTRTLEEINARVKRRKATTEGDNADILGARAEQIRNVLMEPLKFTLSAGYLRKRANALRAEATACELLAEHMDSAAIATVADVRFRGDE